MMLIRQEAEFSLAFRLQYGRGPLSVELYQASRTSTMQGMTQEEVRARLGEPHEVYDKWDGEASWIYYTDTFGHGYLGIRFGPDGRVVRVWT